MREREGGRRPETKFEAETVRERDVCNEGREREEQRESVS